MSGGKSESLLPRLAAVAQVAPEEDQGRLVRLMQIIMVVGGVMVVVVVIVYV